MNKYILTSLLGLLTLGFVFSTYTAVQTSKRLDKFEKQYNTPIVVYPTQAFGLPTAYPTAYPTQVVNQYPTSSITPQRMNLPVDLENAHTWTVQSICNDKVGYEVVYQFDDGTNIYRKDDGTYVRGKKVVCTN